MDKERKEGVMIAAIAILVLVILALLTEWRVGFSDAYLFQYYGIEVSCQYNPADPYSGDCRFGSKIILAFDFKYTYCLIFFLPIILYGILRAFGIIRRLFRFEEKLFKFIRE